MKHHTLLNGLSIDKFHETFVNKPISLENRQLLSWLSFSPEVDCLPTIKEWCDFVMFHKTNATKGAFCPHILP